MGEKKKEYIDLDNCADKTMSDLVIWHTDFKKYGANLFIVLKNVVSYCAYSSNAGLCVTMENDYNHTLCAV